MRPPVHPNIASSSATVAPLLAARVAAILRTPWAEPRTPAARAALTNSLTSRKRLREFREYREQHGRSGLLGHELNLAIANVLSAETNRVTATQPRVEQHVEPHALPGP